MVALVGRRTFHRSAARRASCSPYLAEDVAKYYRWSNRTREELFASFASGSAVIAYNTSLVKAEEAPKSFADLLDPAELGKICKAHPGYSGTIMTASFQIQRDPAGTIWRSSPSSASCGCSRHLIRRRSRRSASALQADGNEYNILQIRGGAAGRWSRSAAEGTPLVVGLNAIFKNAPNLNAGAAHVHELLLHGRCQPAHLRCRRPAHRPPRRFTRSPAASPSRRSRP